MIETIRRYFCDACGREIKGYRSSCDVIEFDDDGNPQSIGYDFCKECTLSFRDWRKAQRDTAAGNIGGNDDEEKTE